MGEARKAAGMEMDVLSRRTRISLANLRAMEADQFEFLPARVYVRGFFKVVASQLGADAKAWLEAVDLALPADELSSERAGMAGWFRRPVVAEGLNVPVRVGHLIAVLLGILTLFLLYFALEGRGGVDETTASSQDGTLLEMLDTRPIQRR